MGTTEYILIQMCFPVGWKKVLKEMWRVGFRVGFRVVMSCLVEK